MTKGDLSRAAKPTAASRAAAEVARQFAERERRKETDRESHGFGGIEPTPERHARNEVEVVEAMGQRTYRAPDPLDRYATGPVKSRTITQRQFNAAKRLRDDYDLGVCGARDLTKGGSSAYRGFGYADAQLDAVERYRNAVQAVGKEHSWVVIAVCCEGVALNALRRREGISRSAGIAELRWVFRRGLDLLADYYYKCEPPLSFAEVGKEVVKEELDGQEISYRHEADSSVSGIFIAGSPWIFSAPTVGALRESARIEIARKFPVDKS